ncbi:hypothetical protein BH11ACT7_BH11ACT7_30330 [soil metagenome]
MLKCWKPALPKSATVFDEDIDLWSGNMVTFAMGFGFKPHRDTLVIAGRSTMTVDRRHRR